MSRTDDPLAPYASQESLDGVTNLFTLAGIIGDPIDFTSSETRDQIRRFMGAVKPVVAALHDLFCLDADMWVMNATTFTCMEADALAALFAALGDTGLADTFLGAHAEGDDTGDEHIPVYGDPEYPQCVTAATRRQHDYPGDDEPRLTGHPPNPEEDGDGASTDN